MQVCEITNFCEHACACIRVCVCVYPFQCLNHLIFTKFGMTIMLLEVTPTVSMY